MDIPHPPAIEFASTHSELPNPQKAPHNDLTKFPSNLIESHPSQSQTNPITDSASLLPHPYYPARWPDPFPPHPTTNPSSATLLPTTVTSTISPHLPPERSIHSEPLRVSLSPSRVFPSSPALSTTPPHFAAPPLQDRTHPDGPPSGRQ